MSNTWKLLIVTYIIIALVIGSYFIYRYWHYSKIIPSNEETTQTNLYGTMLAFNINDAVANTPSMAKVLQNGWTEFKKNSSSYENLKSNLQKIIQDHIPLVKMTGFALDRELVPYFTWNVIEPQKGQFDWELTDIYIKGISDANMKISAIIQPFASWDQKDTQVNANCKMLDAAFFDYKIAPPSDLVEYQNFLTKTVERYKDNVAVWEIGNENDSNCGGYENNPQGYFDLLKISSETIKKADPKAKVTNGADAGGPSLGPGTDSVKAFWTKFFTLGGNQYIDYFNFHYNTERSQNAKLDSAIFQKDLTSINDLMDKSVQGGNDKKPLYLTEFGVYSQTSQAALYFKNSILAFANGTNYIFIDLIESNNNLIGSSMAFNIDGQPRPFLTTLKTIASKIDGFSKSEKITDGQYKFTVGSKTIYALWSGTLPKDISGKIKITNYKGLEQTLESSKIQLSSDQPILLEIEK